MLESIEGTLVTKLPHKKDYDRWVQALTKNEYAAIVKELNSIINSAYIHTAGWMPGHDWTNTPFEPIYTKACKKNVELSGMFFGLIVFKIFMDRPEKWIFGKFEKDGRNIGSLTYFRSRQTSWQSSSSV